MKQAISKEKVEDISLLEPMTVAADSPEYQSLLDLSLELAKRASGFKRSLPEGVLRELAPMVRSMNCYYSNLIEGHDTHPVDIERALKDDYSTNQEKRNLQLEAKAHIAVQAWVDSGAISGQACTLEVLKKIHHDFCSELPDELMVVEDPVTKEKVPVVPGELRGRDVQVGKHIAIRPAAVERFMQRFEEVYSGLGTSSTILNAATAHHRLVWIHPFTDGNGRVARLMSHSMLLDALDTGGIWSIARGLARNSDSYKSHLAACDQQRKGDLDGRGNLSQSNLIEFTKFFLETCIDQVDFMEKLVQPDALRDRILNWAQRLTDTGTLPSKSGRILDSILHRGEVPRGDVPEMLDASIRTSTRAISTLIKEGAITSESTRAPLKISFTVDLASEWMPGLFPQ